jgi:hypothetical protein
VYGTSSASNGYGMYGISSGATWLWHLCQAKGLRYGGYFEGNVHITGSLSGPISSVKLDHPLDPANKHLHHSMVESPNTMSIYNGNFTTDESGEVTIKP